ncbi:MAG: Hcp family type VI secretion system effector [Ancalomicrobiaceae bacterium]|nr:Hcp family type VI secretion system effector [Ancalomicrobiaceae bacterium]
MPTPAYLSIQGSKQGNITSGATTSDSIGNIYQEGHADESLIEGFSAEVIIPRDPQSGQPSGQRVHQPSMVQKYFDKASPLMWQALCTGETMQMTLKFFRTSLTGTQEHYFTIKWTDAVFVDGKGMLPDVLNPQNSQYGNMETWMFSYRKIEWTHEVAGTSGSDDWRSPVTG